MKLPHLEFAMRRLTALPILLVLAVSTSGFAGPQAAPAATSPVQVVTKVGPATTKANADDKVICKSEIPTGSRLGGHRVCMKKSDWDAQSAKARDDRLFAPPTGGAY